MLFIEELNLYANAKIAKWLATGFVIFFIFYHGFLHIYDGGDSCQRLLSDGRFQGSLVWQPYGCMIHSYSKIDTRRCMRYVAFLKESNTIAFVGDSRIRQLYHSFVDQKVKSGEKQIPKLIVMGSATHSIKSFNGSNQGFLEYKQNLTRFSSTLNYLGNTTRVLWMLQDPVVPERLSKDKVAITNEQIDFYNKAAMEILRGSKVLLWSSSRLIAQGSLIGFVDGIHAGSITVNYDTQILLNLYCNHHLNFNDGTCCNSRESFTLSQIIVFALLCTCSITMIVIALKQWLCTTRNHELSEPFLSRHLSYGERDSQMFYQTSFESLLPQKQNSYNEEPALQEVLMAIGKLGLIIGYFFLCDRTNLFMKENKYFSQLNFWLPIGYVFALGLFFTEDTSYTRLLHRDMTNEWKGWMQLVILIYHMTGASQVLPIYLHVRILISSYLFLTGYGHFSYYWSGRDMGIIRYLQIMFRLNFLTVILCLVMNQPYQFYYYVPLVSFWYTVFHITMVLPPRLSKPSHASSEHSPINYFYCIIKFVALGGVITIFFLSEVFFEKVFVLKIWKILFVTADDDIHEWWFRWKLDRYSLLYGMVFGLVYQGMTHYGFIDDKSGSNLLGGRLAFLVSLLAATFSFSYAILAPLCSTRENCNEVHPYMVWVPILGYLTLRNLFGLFRTRYSTFFSWFGSISLEMFVCQYHIWLAADTHGILVLIPSYPVANVLVTSFIFLCACHEIHRITHILVQFVVPFDTFRAIRNISIFIFILVAVAIHDDIV
ncbi:CAS1 domain-containing protein 1 [Armadillidium vulgare]|nr:CAS1 domain-containing protein 1 [Armadillidium vulgare]